MPKPPPRPRSASEISAWPRTRSVASPHTSMSSREAAEPAGTAAAYPEGQNVLARRRDEYRNPLVLAPVWFSQNRQVNANTTPNQRENERKMDARCRTGERGPSAGRLTVQHTGTCATATGTCIGQYPVGGPRARPSAGRAWPAWRAPVCGRALPRAAGSGQRGQQAEDGPAESPQPAGQGVQRAEERHPRG